MSLIIYLIQDLPDYEQLCQYNPPQITRIYTADFFLIEEYGQEKRVYQNIDSMPGIVINTFISAEDKKFFSHSGIDITGIVRAAVRFSIAKITGNKKNVGGASTITQQLVKNLLLDNSKVIKRKVKEIVLAYCISQKFSKSEVLNLYLNHIYFGSGIYGISEAARYYFDKRVQDLKIHEIAYLAGILPSPAFYVKNEKMALTRRAYVLSRMLEDGHIDLEQLRKYNSMPITIKTKKKRANTIYAPYVADKICEIVISKFGEKYFYTRGLTIVSSINSKYQIEANNSLKLGIDNYNNNLKPKTPDKTAHQFSGEMRVLEEKHVNNISPNGGIFVMNHRDGRVLAMSGGVSGDKFNRAISAKRQIGSLVKTFVYLSALENNIEPNTIFTDEPIIVDQGEEQELWRPKNIDKEFIGPMTMRSAFEKSRNIVTIKIGMQLGLNKISEILNRCGIKIPKSNVYLSTLLGACEDTLQNVVNAYATISNGGKKVIPSFVEYIHDNKGELIFQRDASNTRTNYIKNMPVSSFHNEQIIEPTSSYQMISLLQGAVIRGTAKKFNTRIKNNVAGKTGTTNNNCDCWFIGFDANIIVGSYVGYDIPSSMGKNAVGATVCLPIVESFFMNAIVQSGKQLPIYFPTSDNIVLKRVDMKSGEEINTKDGIIEVLKIKPILPYYEKKSK